MLIFFSLNLNLILLIKTHCIFQPATTVRLVLDMYD